jgi:hypothetical protein
MEFHMARTPPTNPVGILFAVLERLPRVLFSVAAILHGWPGR